MPPAAAQAHGTQHEEPLAAAQPAHGAQARPGRPAAVHHAGACGALGRVTGPAQGGAHHARAVETAQDLSSTCSTHGGKALSKGSRRQIVALQAVRGQLQSQIPVAPACGASNLPFQGKMSDHSDGPSVGCH